VTEFLPCGVTHLSSKKAIEIALNTNNGHGGRHEETFLSDSLIFVSAHAIAKGAPKGMSSAFRPHLVKQTPLFLLQHHLVA
jgi:hypothetical protein